MGDTAAVQVMDRAAAAVALQPLRLEILERLREADTAAGVARSLGLSRQRVTYHVRELERAGLVEGLEERRRGNFVERLVRATARSYVVAPQVLGGVGAGGMAGAIRDRFSSEYLLAVASQTIRDVADLRQGADGSGKVLATLSLQSEVRFASVADQHGFAQELAEQVARLVSKYHDAQAERGRTFRVNVVAYPRPGKWAVGESSSGEER